MYFEKVWSNRDNNTHKQSAKEQDLARSNQNNPKSKDHDLLISGHYLVVAVGTGLGAAVLLQT